MYDLIFWAIWIIWGSYFAWGVAGFMRSGQGDINWWIWPPVLLTILPFAVLKLLFDLQTAKMGLIYLNAAAMAIVLIAWFSGRRSP